MPINKMMIWADRYDYDNLPSVILKLTPTPTRSRVKLRHFLICATLTATTTTTTANHLAYHTSTQDLLITIILLGFVYRCALSHLQFQLSLDLFEKEHSLSVCLSTSTISLISLQQNHSGKKKKIHYTKHNVKTNTYSHKSTSSPLRERYAL